MSRVWRAVWSIALVLLILGVIVFGLALITGSDLNRVAEAVFESYDVPAFFESVLNLADAVKGIFNSVF